MDQSHVEPFPLSRFVDYSRFRFYYPFGNTPAEDFLQSVRQETSPNILSLGCGDIRSCFYTLWKHFGPESKSSFTGVHFVLNDRSAAVLARDILFLSLCLTMPEDDATSVRTREWLAAFWSIWYNHELLPKHREVLVAALVRLVEWSESRAKWSKCELGSLVQLTSDTTFQAIRQMWVWWQKGGVGTDVSVSQMSIFRKAYQKTHCQRKFDTLAEQHANTASMCINHKHFALRDENHALKPSMIKDFTTYMDSGNAFAEAVLDLPLHLQHTCVNVTLFECNDYTLHYGSLPYVAFTEYPQYSPSLVARATLNVSQLPVSCDKHFTQTPLLANSVQQFGMWVLAASKMIKHSKCGGPVNLSFTFDCGDAITLCQCLKQFPSKYAYLIGPVPHFNVIDTSNLFDHIPPPALILMCASILKPTGTIFSASLRYKDIGFTGNEYLEKFFGFPPELFPVVFGICCIDHEGKYSSKVATLPVPFNLLHTGISKQAPKLFVWQKVDTEPLKITSLDDEKTICGALCSAAVVACTYPLKPEISDLMHTLSVEVFLVILHQFVSHLHPDVAASSYQFWEPLCQMISQKSEMKPHLLQLQTQSLLHGLHLHLILSEEDCPVCNNQTVKDYIGQCSVSIADYTSQNFVFIANGEVMFTPTPKFMIEIRATSEVNFITSLAGCVLDSGLKLDFFLPRYLAQCKPQFKVMTVGQNLPPTLINSGSLQEFSWSNPQYSFLSAHSQQLDAPIVSSLGEILKHTGNASSIVTIISMSDACVAAKQTYPFKTHQTAFSKLQLKCGDRLQCTICYPYAIDFSKVRIKVSRENRIITVIATRSPSAFYNKHPIFLVDPDNRMAFPPTTFECKTITEYCGLQNAAGDQQDVTLLSYYNIKSSISLLFVRYAENRQRYFILSLNQDSLESSVLILVHELLFDIHFQTPALDLSYCFVDTESEAIHKGLMEIIAAWDYVVANIDKPEYELLKLTFTYFAALTHSQRSIARSRYGTLTKLEKKKINQHFRRAVIYPLYPDPDVRAQEYGLTKEKLGTTGVTTPREPVSNSSATTKAQDKERMHEQESSNPSTTSPSTWKMSCTYCNKPSEHLKKCSRCLAVHYCSKECQTKHWKVHKKDCERDTTTTATPNPKSELKQSFTKEIGKSTEASLGPSRCAKCGKVKDGTKKYCSIECQQLDRTQYPTDGSKLTLPSNCSRCGKDSIKKCSSCHGVFYCSVECQRLDWPQHKTACGKHSDVKKL